VKSGDIVSFNDLQTIFDTNNKIKFKLYSLEYIIEKVNNVVEAYAIDYSTRKSQYNSFKEAMNNFKVYNEPLINQMERINLIEEDDA